MTPALFAFLLQVAPSDSLLLEQALEYARSARAQVHVASAVVDRARGELRVAGTIPNPLLQLDRADLPPTQRVTATQSFSWLIVRGPQRSAARAGIERAMSDSAQQLADIARDVRQAFFRALAASESLRIVLAQAALADSLAQLGAVRMRAGDISQLEREQLEQEAALLRQATSRAREQQRIAALQLARTIGWTDSQAPQPRGSLDDGLDTSRDLAGLDVESIPLLRAAIADSAAAASTLRARQLARVPVPALMAKRESGGGVEPDLILGVALPLPLWNIGGGAVAVARAEAQQRAALAGEMRLAITEQIATAAIRVEETTQRARIAVTSLLPTASRLREGAQRLFEEGGIGILPLFEAVRSERDVALNTIADLLSYQLARADLLALLGRWQ